MGHEFLDIQYSYPQSIKWHRPILTCPVQPFSWDLAIVSGNKLSLIKTIQIPRTKINLGSRKKNSLFSGHTIEALPPRELSNIFWGEFILELQKSLFLVARPLLPPPLVARPLKKELFCGFPYQLWRRAGWRVQGCDRASCDRSGRPAENSAKQAIFKLPQCVFFLFFFFEF